MRLWRLLLDVDLLMRLPSMDELLASLSITCSFCQRTVGRGMKLYEIVNDFEGDVNLVIGEMKNRLQTTHRVHLLGLRQGFIEQR